MQFSIETEDNQEYLISESADTPTDWSSPVKGTGNRYTFNSLKPQTAYYIHTRIGETDYAMPSLSKSTAQCTLPTTPDASAVTIHYDTETVTYADTLEVSTTNTDNGNIIAGDGKIPETSMGKNIYVRVKAVAGGAPASEWRAIAITARPTTPSAVKLDAVTKTDTNIKIANTVSTQEYSVDGGVTWNNDGSFTVSADTAYNIVTRVKATSQSFASNSSNPISVKTLKTTKITEVSNKLRPKYNPDAPIDLTELFTVTEGYDGTPTYTVTNVTGAGTVSGNKFTVTKAGEFDVKISAPTTAGYYEASVSTKLIVLKADGTGGVEIDSWTYGDTANDPIPSSTTNSIDNVTYEYAGRNNTVYPNSSIKPTNAGEYSCTAIFPANDLYYGPRLVCGLDIDQRRITVLNGDYKVTKIYDGKTDAGTASGAIDFSNVIASDSGVAVKVGTIPEYSKSTVGNYEITVPISIDGDTNNNYKIAGGATTLTVPGEIVYLDTPNNPYTLSPALNTDGWANEVVTITPAPGYTISETLNGTYTNSITLSETQKDVKIYLKNAKGQMTDAVTVGDINIDKVKPTGDITFNKNSVKKAINSITFGRFFKDNIDVVIASSDNEGGSGLASTEYYRSEKKLEENEVNDITDWKTYLTLSEKAVDKEKFIYYVKITDKAGNVTIFGSDGTTFDTTAPDITGVKDKEAYYVTQKVVISDTNLDEVTLNGVKSTSPITLDGNAKADYTIKAVDKATNETTVKVSMEPISTITEDFSNLTTDDIKSSEKSKIEAAQEILNNIDLTNATEDEKTLIDQQKKLCIDLLEKIDDTTEKIKNVTEEIAKYDSATVKSPDKENIEELIKDLDVLLATDNLTEEEKVALNKTKDTANNLLGQIKAAGDSVKKVLAENPGITDTNVKITDKDSLNAEKAEIEKVLKDYDGNLTDTEKKTLNTRLNVVNSALERIKKAEHVQKLIDALADPSKITKNDEKAILAAKKAYEALTDYEKSMVNKSKLDKALKALENAKKSNSAQTGDSSNLLLWFTLLLVSGAGATILGVNKKRKNQKSK